ncbi:MAG: DUF3078 domain-containing protein [Tenuifilaceae bacterium]|jgi:hypothetical protein|nr:DUF3078 domain-containing protein [Tenuifilaceae bacterium]
MKTKTAALIALLLAVYIGSTAQVTDAEGKLKAQSADTLKGWKKGGVIGFNLAQTSLTNWAAGGEKSVAINGLFSVFANYKSEKSAWDNSLDLGYGVLNQGNNDEFRKTDDKIDFLSKYGRKAYKNFYYAALFNAKTQMTRGYKYADDGTETKISNIFAPAYFVAALGMDYKPNAYLSVFAAPITGKVTVVNDESLSNAGAFGVDPSDKTKSEFGGYIRMIYSKNDFTQAILKNVTFTTKLDLFSNYIEDPQNIVVNWETLIALKVNKYINVNLMTHLIYDDKVLFDVDDNNDGVVEKQIAKVQFKEIFGVGLSYKF